MSNEFEKLYGDQEKRYPITRMPKVVYGGGGKVLGYHMEDNHGNTTFIDVKNREDLNQLKKIQQEKQEKQEEYNEGLILFLFKEHTPEQLVNMFKSKKFEEIKESLEKAIGLYKMYNDYIESKGGKIL